jgi:LSD1 subclass zinc finger protein
MKVGDCPSCRAPVEFEPGAGKVKVCGYCQTVVLRGEANLESLGRVSELVDTNSPLKLGLAGTYSGSSFTIAGRIQKQNATGTWDEWCLAFDDGRTGWLSESEGEWNFMFPLTDVQLPAVEKLRPLAQFQLRDKRFVVEERNEATTLAAEGQLPEFNRQHVYADCTGPKGVFASLDYADGHGEAFVGSRVSLSLMGFNAHDLQPTPRRDALSAARCTECNGMLDLKAPDSAKRVGCPFCGALLDVAHGKLAFLQLLEKPPQQPLLPLGAVGTLGGTQWTVLAYLIRSCTVEGTRYPWDEYLLWNQEHGFTWLMQANRHWTWLKPVPAGTVAFSERGALHEGRTYRTYQTVFARTDYVVGECYWTVSVGDLAKATEFIAPPHSLNQDQTETEVTFTLGELVPAATIAQAFKLRHALPTPSALASAQVNPFTERASRGWKWSALWAMALLAAVVVFSAAGTTTTYYRGDFSVPSGAASGSPEAQQFSERFEIPVKVPLELELDAPALGNGWTGVSVDLVHEQSGEVVSVYGEVSEYHGVSEGESWSEGSRSATVQTSEVDPGLWVLRATPHFEPGRPVGYSLRVKADGGAGAFGPLCVFLLLFLVPLYHQLRSSGFETERWGESVFQTAPDVSNFPNRKDDGDDDSDD